MTILIWWKIGFKFVFRHPMLAWHFCYFPHQVLHPILSTWLLQTTCFSHQTLYCYPLSKKSFRGTFITHSVCFAPLLMYVSTSKQQLNAITYSKGERRTFAKTTPNIHSLYNLSIQHEKGSQWSTNTACTSGYTARYKLSIRRAAEIYRMAERTLRRRCNRTPSRRDCMLNSMKLTKTEEEVIVQHILKLDERGCPPQLSDVEGVANSLLAERHQSPVGKNWAGTFVKRRSELKVRLNRNYDYRTAKCEDPEVIKD